MKHTPDISCLAAAHEYVARMVAERSDGAAYLPLFERLEKELETVSAQESAIERARRISLSRAGL